MQCKLKYGKQYKSFTLSDDLDVTFLETRQVELVQDVAATLHRALDAPLGAARLEDRPRPASVAIAVPDETRPTPLKVLLPVLFDRLFAAYPGLAPEAVSVVVGGGLHPAPDAAQLARILPEDLRGVRVVSHDALQSPLRSYGATSRGTPVEINAVYAEAELKIVIGQIDPHQFVGFTGGAKGVTVGLASKAMIQASHSLMAKPGAEVGRYRDNPVRQDLTEAGEIVGVDLAINVVLSGAKQVAALLVGRPALLVPVGAEISSKVYGLPIDEPFDMVVASCGGDPKDICLYQAQKGLNLASQCLRPGGKILLLAACPQGIGDEAYENYVRRFATPSDQLDEFCLNGFRMGAHKAFLFSTTLTRFEVAVVSELDAKTLAACHLSKVELEETLAEWTAALPRGARIALVPNANTTYFYRT